MADAPGGIERDSDALEPSEPLLRRTEKSSWLNLAVAVLAIAIVVVAILIIQELKAGLGANPGPAISSAGGGSDGFTPVQLGVVGKGSVAIGDKAPRFQLQDPEGNVIRLEDFRGRQVLVNFWATWCAPCRREIPDLIRLQQEWGAKAQLIGVDLQESPDVVAEFAARFGINYPLPLDRDGAVFTSYKLTGLPETFFLDADGVVRDHRIGLLRPDVAKCIVTGIERGDHEPKACR